MDIACVIFCIAMFFVGKKTEKKVINPLSVFCLLWGIVIFLSNIHLFNLYLPKESTYTILIFGIISFVFGYYATKILIGNKQFKFRIKVASKRYRCNAKVASKRYRCNAYKINYKILYLAFLICIPFYIKDLVSVISSIGFGNSLSVIQGLMQGNDDVFTRSAIESTVLLLFVHPFSWISCPIVAVDFWMGKRDIKLLILQIVTILMRIFTTGGRAVFIQFMFYFFCVFMLSRSNDSKSLYKEIRVKEKKNKRLFLMICVVGLAILALLTYSRAGQAAIRTIYYDFAMPPIMFEKWIDTVKEYPKGYGMASLNGFLYPIDYILRNSVHVSLPETFKKIYDLIQLTDTEWKWIGNGVIANAYISAFCIFYIDGRQVGVILASMIYGFICRNTYSKVSNNYSVKSVAVFCLVLVGVFYTFGTFEFSQYSYVLALIYIRFFFKKTSSNMIES